MHNNLVENNLLIENSLADHSTLEIFLREERLVRGTLILEDGTVCEGTSFGYLGSTAGEVVFCTGRVG